MRTVPLAIPALSIPVLLAVTTLSAWGKANVCSTLKVRAAGKSVARLATCHGKAVDQGLAPDATCLQKAHDRLPTGFSKAESKGQHLGQGCLTTGDAAAISDVFG